jgi:hypothetical protein
MKWQGWEVEDLYRISGMKAQGREPIRDKEYGIRLTNRELSSMLQRVASLMIRPMYLDFLARILVLCSWIR